MLKFSNENIKERKVVILFLHDSVGELFVTLPIFWFLKNYTDVEIYFVSHHSDILKRMNISKRYVEIMQEIGSFHFGNLKSIKLLAYLWLENNATIQMSCNLGARRIDRIYYSFLKKSSMVFFTHAFMLYPFNRIKNIAKNEELNKFIKSQFFSAYGTKSDLLILNSEESNYFLEKGWHSSSIHSIGAIGYSKDWLNYLFKLNILENEKDEKKPFTIFVPLRDSHKYYLTEDNYDYMINSLKEIFESYSNFNFVVKLHPRQKTREIFKTFSKYNNVSFSTNSPFELALKSDLSIGFWSSALTDSVAAGTPAIEFHRHEVPHPQLVKKEKKLISLNEYLGLCKGFDDVDLLKSFLSNINFDNLHALQKDQYEKLLNCYNLNRNYKNRLLEIFEALFEKASKANYEQKSEKSFFALFKKIVIKFFSLPGRVFR